MSYQSYENWNKRIKPLLEESLNVCTTDVNYLKEANYLLNKIDSLYISEPKFIHEMTEALENVLTSKQYYQNVHKSSMPEEINLLKEICDELIVFRKLVFYEFNSNDDVKVEEIKKERFKNEELSVEDIYKVDSNKQRFI